MATILTNRGVEYQNVFEWVRSHRLYDVLMGGADTMWRDDRERMLRSDERDDRPDSYLKIVHVLRATEMSRGGGLAFGGGHRPGEEIVAECHRAARAAAGVILSELAAAIDADQAEWLSRFTNPNTPVDVYTRSWRAA